MTPADQNSAMDGDHGSTESTKDLVGRQIGRYLLESRLGSGGVATVYQAYDQVDGRSVALKVLLPTADPNTISRFRHEALTAGGLKHAHIVRIFQVGTAMKGEIAYMAMELVEGDSLADWLGRMGRLRPEETCNLLEPIARAMAFAHRAGVVHRDIKPSNILLRPTTPGVSGSIQLESADYPVVPLLSDFGIAHSTDSPELTHAGRTVGTPAYMAPEQCAGNRAVDGRADIYSLCTVLYRSVVGHLPFSGSTTQMLHAHVYAPLTIDDDILRQLPPLIVDIMKMGLAKLPDDRYADADALADDLALGAGRPVAVTAGQGSASTAPDSTATLTLSSLGTVAGTQTPRSRSVLVPGGRTGQPHVRPLARVSDIGSADPVAGHRASGITARERAPSLAGRLEQFNWIGYGLSTLAALLLIIGGTLAALNLPQLLDRLQLEPNLFGAATPLAASVQNGGLLSGGAGGLGGSPDVGSPDVPALGVAAQSATPSVTPTALSQPIANQAVIATPLSDFLSVLTPVPDAPTVTLAPTASPTPEATEMPSATLPPVAPEPSPAAPTAAPEPSGVVTPSLPTVEPAPEAIVTSQPISVSLPISDIAPLDDVVFACTSVIDSAFLQFIGGMPDSGGVGFRCPNAEAVRANGRLLRFEHGFMMDLENSPAVYVYYDANQEWERAVSSWRDDDPAKTGEFEPPAPFLYQPQNAFGQLWADPWRQIALGFATTEQPVSFSAVEQIFPAGALVGDESNGFIYLFLREKLRL
jgi:serine/threonine protein kinase